MAMIERPAGISADIATLLAEGDVAQLCSGRGRLLQEFMTADEKDAALRLPMSACPGFDGTTCDHCRGHSRYWNCPQCQGSFDGLREAKAS